jgi:hypothetical protein
MIITKLLNKFIQLLCNFVNIFVTMHHRAKLTKNFRDLNFSQFKLVYIFLCFVTSYIM